MKFSKPDRRGVDPGLTEAPDLWHRCVSALAIFDGTIHDIAKRKNGALVATTGSATLGVGPIGRMIAFNVSARRGQAIQMDHLAGIFDGATELTLSVIVRFIGSSSSAEDTLCGQWSSLQGSVDSNARRAFVRYDSLNQELDFFLSVTAGDTSQVVSAPDVDDGDIHVLTARWDGAEMATFFDGRELGTRVSFAGPLRSEANSKVPEFMGGHVVTNIGTDSPRFEFYGGMFWLRGLSDGECEAHGQDPFAMVRMADEVPVFVAAVAGRIMSSLAGSGGLAYKGGIAGIGGGLAG